jgi:hypothetical protein
VTARKKSILMTGRRRSSVRALATAVVAALLLAGYALAQSPSAANFYWWSIGSGSQRQSAGVHLHDATGQTGAGVSSSNSYRIEGGFVVGEFAGEIVETSLFLPIVQK